MHLAAPGPRGAAARSSSPSSGAAAAAAGNHRNDAHCRRQRARVSAVAASAQAADDAAPSPAPYLFPRHDSTSHWRVRPLDTQTRAPQPPTWLNDEVRRVAQLQSEAFLPPPPSGAAGVLLAPLQPLARASFSAEVLDALRGKTKGVADGSFAVLVAERVAGGDADADADADAAAAVDGVVELRVAADADVLTALRRGAAPAVTAEQVAAAVAVGWGPDEQQEAGRPEAAPAAADASAEEAPLPPLEGDDAPLPPAMGSPEASSSSSLSSSSPSAKSAAASAATPSGLGALAPFGPTSSSNSSSNANNPKNRLRRVAYLASMAVDGRCRRGGAARAMLGAAEALAACWGLGVMALHVYADNAPALALYASGGWLEVEREPAWMAVVPGKRPRVLLAKRVGRAARREAVVAEAAAVAAAVVVEEETQTAEEPLLPRRLGEEEAAATAAAAGRAAAPAA
jgi:hypothetical protein